MDGLQIKKFRKPESPGDDLVLLAKNSSLEIMRQFVKKGAVLWLTPAEEENSFEYYYVLSGAILLGQEAEEVRLTAGDSFSVANLQKNVLLRCHEDTLLLCISDIPVYDDSTSWRNTWMKQLERINYKDHYTLSHSKAVMHYAVKLYQALADRCPDIKLNDFVMASLFHDIGKIHTPEEILGKPGKLTNEEYAIMKLHPLESKKILEPLFGEKLANIAWMHHERLDGSGYPQGLKGDEIPFEVRILSIADTFDAMTRDRVYHKAEPLLQVAQYLCSQSAQYDLTISKVLLDMVQDGRISRYGSESFI